MRNPDPKELKYVIFDCDGVLVDSEIIASQVSVRLLKSYGFDMEPKVYAKVFAGKVEEDIISEIRDSYKIQIPDDFNSMLRLEIENALDLELQPIEGVKETLDQISLSKAVVSNSRLVRVIHSLKIAGLDAFFGDNVFSSDMVARPKPFPDLYMYAAKKLDVLPHQCLVVEDSISGATAAFHAGMNVMGFLGASHIPKGHGAELQEVGVFTTAQNMNELNLLLQNLLGNQ